MSAIATPAPAGTTTPPPANAGPRPLKWTRTEFLLLDKLGMFKDKRVELIRGEIFEMGKPSWSHVLGISKLSAALRAAFGGIGSVIEQGPHPTDDSDPMPDVRVVPGQLTQYTDHPTTALLLVEVSDTTLSFDLTTKAELYATAGVTDYWVFDVNGRVLHVFRDPQPLSLPTDLAATAYRTHLTLSPADSVSPLAAPGATICVADLLP